jgi:hypothetical protein
MVCGAGQKLIDSFSIRVFRRASLPSWQSYELWEAVVQHEGREYHFVHRTPEDAMKGLIEYMRENGYDKTIVDGYVFAGRL